jgi:3D (Asp-Asp-Asp) domain-containing protein
MINEKTKKVVIRGAVQVVITASLMTYPLYKVTITNHQLIQQLEHSKQNVKTQEDINNNLNSKLADTEAYVEEREQEMKEAEELKRQNNELREENEILKKYQDIKKNTIVSRGGSISNGGLRVQKVKVEISMYSRQEFNNNTASGTRPVSHSQNKGYVTIAAPDEIPFGTEFILPGLQDTIFRVEDRGSYIKKVGDIYRLDVFVETTAEAMKYGRQTEYAYIIVKN